MIALFCAVGASSAYAQTTGEASLLRSTKKRSFLRLPSTDPEGKPDSEDERVVCDTETEDTGHATHVQLNEVAKQGSAPVSEAVTRSTTPTPDEQRPHTGDSDTVVYIPPYKTRKPYQPVPIDTFSADSTGPTAISVFAAVTRHHEVPYAATRRLEVRLAWTEPATWVWVPGRKYIPDWKVNFVARRVEDGIVRKTVKGILGYTPVFWRLAEWI